MAASSKHSESVKPLAHFGAGVAVVIAAALLTYACHDTAFMNRLEMANLDSWMSFQPPLESSEIVVVEITDSEYRSMFGGRSPLTPGKVSALIGAIAAGHPRVIGIDLDTADWTAAERGQVRDHYAVVRENGSPKQIPLVWALGGYGAADAINVDAVAGSGAEDCFAVPATIEDPDGVARWYLPSVVSQNKRWPGFPTAVLDMSRGESKTCRAEDVPAHSEAPKPEKVNLRGGRIAIPHLAASTVLGAASTEAWAADNPLKGKIVLLGGAYRAARDSYMTPVGRLNGVDILAHSILTELPGGAIRDASEFTFISVDILIGLAMVTVTYFARSAWMLLASLAVIVPVAFLASLVAYSSYAYFASFMPVLLGVFIHEVIEHIIEHRRLLHEVEELRSA